MTPGESQGPAEGWRAVPRAVWYVVLAALAYHVAAGAVGWNHRIIQDDVSTFRQTQTALNTYWMLDYRYRIAYETPVFGPPWSMPYELPLYEWVVAGVVTVTGLPLDQAGRAVAQGFFLLCLAPCWWLMGRLGVSPRWRAGALVLLLVSPFYVFWSRTFLIETTALFLALSYLAAAWATLDRPRVAVFLPAVALGVLAATVKITTCAAAWLALGLVLLGCLVRPGRGWRLAAWVVLVGVPLAAGVLWTHFADGLKEQNPFARHLTSAALREWNFGTWAQRESWKTWGHVFCRTPSLIRQNLFLVAALLLAPLAGRLVAVAACALIYLTLPLVFTNLYAMHEYYACASMVFLVGAVALTAAGLDARGGWRSQLGRCLAVVFLAFGLNDYVEHYYRIQSAEDLESAGVCRAVQEQTGPDDVIVVLGCDWSSEVPYYCRRRALMVPSWEFFPLEDLPHYLEPLRDYRVGGLVIYRRSYVAGWQVDDALRDLRAWGVSPELAFEDNGYTFYTLRPPEYAVGDRAP